jgi:hypothetical protein
LRRDIDVRLKGGRVRSGIGRSDDSWGLYGSFRVWGPCGAELTIVASGADYPETEGFEHVSVSTRRRCPNWEEMCFVKDLFWGPEECVFQLHPPRSQWVNNHSFCLHLWRNVKVDPPMPPSFMVGDARLGTLNETVG